MWKKPNRPTALISQPFNSGIVNIFETYNAAPTGYQPDLKLRAKISLRYDERKVGVARFYTAMQNQIQIDRLIRVQNGAPITNQDVAITEDGQLYRIEQIQTVSNVYPRSIDLSLRKIEEDGLYAMV